MQNLSFFIIAALISILILFSGCIQQHGADAGGAAKTTAELASEECMQLCESEMQKGTDLSTGPCLSNEITKGWVCDVAHSPRAAVDNVAGNQCSAFGKTASHFVEVDEGCKVIKVV